MKKLLGILGTITMAGSGMTGIVGNAPVSTKNEINYSQASNLRNLNRTKRGTSANLIEFYKAHPGLMGYDGIIYCTFEPVWWEEVENIKAKNTSIEDFANRFTNKVFDGVWMDHRIEQRSVINELGKFIYENFSTISNVFRNSDKKHRIRIVINTGDSTSGSYKNFRLDVAHMREGTYPNLYLDNLQGDFPDWNKETIILGIVDYDGGSENNLHEFLKQIIKKKYPNLNINNISFENRTEYNPNENYNYSIKMNINADCQYSHGLLKPRFFYTTKHFLKNVLPRLIKENGKDLMQDWQNKFNVWMLRIERQIKEDVPTFTEAQKKNLTRSTMNNFRR